MKKIHVGFLMSYDYEMLKKSIPPVYSASDAIFIALDRDLRTWSGEKFEIHPEFFKWLEKIDVDNKITIYRDNFYDPELTAMENEVKERHMLALQMGIGNWLVQVDSDEYFLNFEKFAEDLHTYDHFLENPEENRIQIAAFLINLYKYVDDGVLYVDQARQIKFVTNYPDYKTGRNTKQRVIYTKNLLLHECLSRTEEEVLNKLRNWGHSHQINSLEFMEKWRKVDKTNYKEYSDFFYLEPAKWKRLNFVKGNTVPEINKSLNHSSMMPSNFFLWKKNFGQWFKFLFK